MNENHKPTVKILVACHKADKATHQDEVYMPIHVGKALHPEMNLGFQGDDTGDNISLKNGTYCELTALYWAWKNLKGVDVIGLCHYRRYFDFHKHYKGTLAGIDVPTNTPLDYSVPQTLIDKVQDGAVVVARPIYYRYSLMFNYVLNHMSEDFRILENIVKTTQPKDIVKAFKHVVCRNNELSHYNMFLIRWSDFDAYCTWLFDLLSKVEGKTNIESYSPEQARIYGYIAERLLNVWLYAKKKHIICKPVLRLTDNPNDYKLESSAFKRFYNKWMGKLVIRIIYS